MRRISSITARLVFYPTRPPPRARWSSSSSDSRTSCNPCFPADDGRRRADEARGVALGREPRAEAGVELAKPKNPELVAASPPRGLSAMARLCAAANAASASASARRAASLAAASACAAIRAASSSSSIAAIRAASASASLAAFARACDELERRRRSVPLAG